MARYPYQQILAIDYLYGSLDQMEQDFALLDARYQRYAQKPRQDFDRFVALIRKLAEADKAR